MNNSLVYFLNSQGVILMVVGVLLFLYFTEKKKEVFNHTLLVVMITLFVTIILKELFNTPRPFISDKSIIASAGMAFLPSFPSTHAALSFSVATIVSIHKRRLGMFLLVLASLVSVGRVAGRVHYPIDVAFGILLGVTIALFFDKFHIKRLSKLKKSS